MKNRIKELRNFLGLTQEGFSKRLGVPRNSIAGYEIGRREPSKAVVSLICREFNVKEEWLLNGEGEMFIKFTEADEIALFVSELLENEDNDIYVLIIDIMRAYNELSPSSQDTLKELVRQMRNNMNRKKEG